MKVNYLSPLYIYKKKEKLLPLIKKYKDYCSLQLALLGFPVTYSDSKLMDLKDKHRGERCFIIGNGPSLRIEDLDRLKGEITFGCNKIYLAFDSTDWRPSYYTVVDMLVAKNNNKEIAKLELSKIFPVSVKRYFSNFTDDIIWIRELRNPFCDGKINFEFSKDAICGFFGGWTVLYMQIQLAFHMGIREIYLIGVDFSFQLSESTGKICWSSEILRNNNEKNHFHPEYRKKGEEWTFPRLDLQYQAFLHSRKIFQKCGGKIYNASRKTALDVFPLINFDKLI